jgi:hypothetical protein
MIENRVPITPDQVAGIWWWKNSLSEAERLDWLKRAGSARWVDAWTLYKRFTHPA